VLPVGSISSHVEFLSRSRWVDDSISVCSLRGFDMFDGVWVSYLQISRRAAERSGRMVFLGERLSCSEFGWTLEVREPCKDCLNFLSTDSLGRVNCSGDPVERSPGSEECLAYVPLGVVKSIDRSRELSEVSRKATVDLRRSVGRESPVVKECGCRVCGVLLTDENWYPIHRRRHSHICKSCHKKYQAEQRRRCRLIAQAPHSG